ncbi:MAG: lysylphosphatidylglycerol synthase transmembrane domain-containing protein [Terricaulis sp.]
MLATWRGHRLSVALSSVLLERFVMVFTLVVLICALIPMIFARLGALPGLEWSMAAFLAASVCGIAFLMLADRVLALHPLLVTFGRSRMGQLLLALSGDTRRLFGSRWIIWSSVLAYGAHLNQVFFAAWLGAALSLDLSLTDYLTTIPLIFLVTLLPISIGGWGVREGVSVIVLGAVGVARADALAFSILFGASVALVSLAALPMWWADAKRRPREAPAPEAAV